MVEPKHPLRGRAEKVKRIRNIKSYNRAQQTMALRSSSTCLPSFYGLETKNGFYICKLFSKNEKKIS